MRDLQMRLLLAVCLPLMAGCASVESFTAPDGRAAFVVSCGGELQSIAACHAKAREACGGDYSELNRSITQRSAGSLGSTENRTVEVVCAAKA